MENKKYWYAVMQDKDDNDWGSGTFDRAEALTMLQEQEDADAYIAVIDGNYDENGNATSDTICIEEIHKERTHMEYIIRDKEAGNFIDSFKTLAEAEAKLAEYEKADKADGTYTPDFYEIVETDKQIDTVVDYYK